MKSLINLLITFILLTIPGMVSSQRLEIPKDRLFTKNQILEDYEILYQSLKNYHPSPLLYIVESDLKAFYDEQISTFPESMSELEFHIAVRQLIAQIKCGHTYAKPSDAWYKSLQGNSVLLPFDIKRIGNKVYINNRVDEDFDFEINDEVLSINDVPINEILSQMAAIQERDGYTQAYVNEMIIKKFRTYFLFLNDVQEEILLEFKSKTGEIKSTILAPANKRLQEAQKPELPAPFKIIYENSWSSFAMDTKNSLAYLKISSFDDRKEFKKYYELVFKQLAQMPDFQLILDLRDNTGGFFRNGNKLLTYLTPNVFEFNFQKPKKKIQKNKHAKLDIWNKLTKLAFSIKPSKHKIDGQKTHTFTYKPDDLLFRGKVNVLTNGVTFSQAALVAAQLKENGAIFFGAETGGTESSTNAMVNYQLLLPNSAIKVFIAHYQVVSNSTKGEFGYGIKPNYELFPDLDSVEDKMLMKVVNKIGDKG